MANLFSAGVSLMNRLSYPQKFAVISVLPVLLFTVIVFLMTSKINAEIDVIQKERAGLEYMSPLRELLENTQKYRGLSNAYMNGNTAVKDELESVFSQININIQEVDRVNQKLGAVLVADKQWDKIKNILKYNLKADTKFNEESAFYLNTMLNAEILDLIHHIGDTSYLILDPDINNYYLIDIVLNNLLSQTETLGQARGIGSGVVAKKSITSDEKIKLIFLTGSIKATRDSITKNINTVVQNNPSLLSLLQAYNEVNTAKTNTFLNVLDPNNIINEEKLQIMPRELFYAEKNTYYLAIPVGILPQEYFQMGTAAIDSNFKFYDVCSAALDQLLEAKINRLSSERNVALFFVLIALGVVLYLLIAFYISVIRKIITWKKSILRMSVGDLTTKIILESKDELQEVDVSLNKLAVAFNRMIAEIKNKEYEIEDQKQFYENVIQNSLTPMFVIDSNHNVIIWNGACEQFTGIKSSDIKGIPTRNVFFDELRPSLADIVLGEDYQNYITDYRVLRESDVLEHGLYAEAWVLGGRYIAMNAAPVYNSNGAVIAAIQTMQEITGNKLTEDRLLLANNVFDNTLEGIIVIDSKGSNIQWVNNAFTQITGYSMEEVMGTHLYDLRSDQHSAEFYKMMWDSIFKKGRWQGEMWNRRKNGEAYPEWMTIIAIKDDKGEVLHYVFVFSDITSLKLSEKKLEYLAHFDPLTELPNRVLFNERLNQAIARAEKHNELMAVLFLDLDHFKLVNDTYGHSNGDLLLQFVAKRLKDCVRKSDTVSRLGGDEFTIILPFLKDKHESSIIAQNIISSFSQPFSLEGQQFFVTTSIGISLYSIDGDDSDSLVKNADIAMYHAKDQGRNKYQFYNADMIIETFGQLQMENLLHNALEQNQFVLHYQPQVNLQTNEIIGMEALVRMKHTDQGHIPPAQFIAIAEKTGLIVPIGEWVLRTACAQNKKWQEAGFRPMRIAVNLSARQFQQDNLVELVKQVLKETDLEAGYLELEITESISMFHIDRVMAILFELDALGVRISIDDFGTGHSSLNYLKHFPIDSLKIDRSFISDIVRNSEDSTIATSIISMAKQLKLEVIAEGVESEVQLAFLREMKCDIIQGYLISKPLEAAKIEQLLKLNEKQLFKYSEFSSLHA